jgi:hypothetical protein
VPPTKEAATGFPDDGQVTRLDFLINQPGCPVPDSGLQMKWFDHIPKSASGAKEPYMGGSQSAVLIRYAPKPEISYFVRPHANLEAADARR